MVNTFHRKEGNEESLPSIPAKADSSSFSARCCG